MRFIIVNLILLLNSVFLCTETYAKCKSFEIKGTLRTYNIIEHDLEEVIKQRLSQINWKEEQKKARERFWKYKPLNSIVLKEAKEHKIRYHKPIYYLPVDIKDAFGNIIYPKGTEINPLDYMNPAVLKTQVVIAFNAKDKNQVKYISNLLQKNKSKEITLLANCNAELKDLVKLMKKIKFPVYFIDKTVAKHFGIEKVLSIVKPVFHNGENVFKIEEIPSLKRVERTNEKNKNTNN